MFKLLKINKKNYTLIYILLICLCSLLGLTYSTFIFSSNDYRASEMYIGSLMYSMKINGANTSVILAPPGETEYEIEITSLNNVDSYYKLIHKSTPNIIVEYNSDENDNPSGNITNTKTIRAKITNSSSNSKNVEFEIAAGYITNELSNIIVPAGYEEIDEVFITNDIKFVAFYVDGEPVNSLDNSKNYKLKNYECTNGESVEWNNSSKKISIYPIQNTSSCTLYFEESRMLYETLLASNSNGLSDQNIDFGAVSSYTNGEGLYYTSNLTMTEDYNQDGTGDRVYYFRGNVNNNHLYFADKCWRIVRTVEDGSIRLRYNGTGTIDSVTGKVTCPDKGSDTSIGDSYFNSNYNNNTYVGYMTGSSCSNYTTCHSNVYNSNVKTTLTTWYENNILNKSGKVQELVKDSVYCNDRGLTSGSGVGTAQTYYKAWGRLVTGSPKKPSLKCTRTEDKFTQLTSNGNGKNTYPIGLLTMDEVALAGGVADIGNSSYYLYTNSSYWTMTPGHYYGVFGSNSSQVMQVLISGAIMATTSISISGGVFPVISIDKNAEINSGDGSRTNAFVINPDV